MLLAKGGRKRTWLKVAFFRLLFFCELAVGGGFGRVEKCGSLSFYLFKEGPTCLFVQFCIQTSALLEMHPDCSDICKMHACVET